MAISNYVSVGGAGGFTSPMTTTGDMIYSSSGSTAARLAVGSTSQLLTVTAGLPAWATVSSSPADYTVSTSTTPTIIAPLMTDSATAVGLKINTPALSTTGSFLQKWFNNGDDKSGIDKLGNLIFTKNVSTQGIQQAFGGCCFIMSNTGNSMWSAVDQLGVAPAAGIKRIYMSSLGQVAAQQTVQAATGNEVAFQTKATINKATSGNYTSFLVDSVETSAPGTGNLIADFQVAGVSKASVSTLGVVTATGTAAGVTAVKTSNYTATVADSLVLASVSGGAWILTLPACNAGKWIIQVKMTDVHASNQLTIARAGSDTITTLTAAAATSFAIGSVATYNAVELRSDGTSVAYVTVSL